MKNLMDKFKSKKFRDIFAADTVARRIAHRIRSIREEREQSQSDVAAELKTSQSVVSRFENPTYGKYSYKALQAIAKVFDVVLWVDFITHAEFLRRIKAEDAWAPVPKYDGAADVPVAAENAGASVQIIDLFSRKKRPTPLSPSGTEGGKVLIRDNDITHTLSGGHASFDEQVAS
jgi:transcriptional regulator with XRE-family HTH domain